MSRVRSSLDGESRLLGPRPLLVGATIVALVATAGSLYLSEVWGLLPCELCWFQRILMYPLVVVFGVAAIERRPGVWRTTLPLAGLGTVVAAYHSYIQLQPSGASGCTLGGCSAIQFRLEPLGLTVPNLALVAFLLLVGASIALWWVSE